MEGMVKRLLHPLSPSCPNPCPPLQPRATDENISNEQATAVLWVLWMVGVTGVTDDDSTSTIKRRYT